MCHVTSTRPAAVVPRCWIAFVQAALVLSASCGNDEQRVEPEGEVDLSLGGAQAVFTASCALAGCHKGVNAAAEMSLERGKTYDAVVNVRTVSYCGPQGIRVVPGNSEGSCLWQLVSDDTMPLGAGESPPTRGALPAADKETIRRWITDDAPR